MKVRNDVGLLAGVLTLIYGIYLVWVFALMVTGLWRPTSSSLLNPLVLASLDMIVYLILGVKMLRDAREFFVLAVFWTIFGVALATFAATYRSSFLNFLSFLIVFFSTYYHATVTKTDEEVTKSLGLLAGILSFVQGIYVAMASVSAYIFLFEGWIIPALPTTQDFLAPPLTIATITAAVYLVSGVGMMRCKKEFFVLAVLWTIVESALAIADPSYTLSHFNIISILILAFATYYYFAKTKP